MTLSANYIRAKAKEGKLIFSQHAIERMGERKIWKSSIINAILEGEEIGLQGRLDNIQNKDVKVLFQEATDDTPEFYVVVAASFPVVEVITVCYFKDEVWEWTGKIMRRMRKS
jgi:hypothetical protein